MNPIGKTQLTSGSKLSGNFQSGNLINIIGFPGLNEDNRLIEKVWCITTDFLEMAKQLDDDESATRQKSYRSCHDKFRQRHFELLWTYKKGLIEAFVILEDFTQLSIEFLVME